MATLKAFTKCGGEIVELSKTGYSPMKFAGKWTRYEGDGFADERHLWPSAHWLIAQRRPITIFGEQVASKDGLNWLDTVRTDLENTAYTSEALDLCAASCGAPHIRQRLYWCANSTHSNRGSRISTTQTGIGKNGERRRGSSGDCIVSSMPHSTGRGFGVCGSPQGEAGFNARTNQALNSLNTLQLGLEGYSRNESNRGKPGWLSEIQTRSATASGATNGFWRDCDWWEGTDGKARPIEPGLFPLAYGVSSRVGRLRGYGNAIVPQLAAAFIEATEGW